MKKHLVLAACLLFQLNSAFSDESGECRSYVEYEASQDLPKSIDRDLEAIDVTVGRLKMISSKVYYADGAEDQISLLIPGEKGPYARKYESHSLISGEVYANGAIVRSRLKALGVGPLPEQKKDCADFLALLDLAQEGNQLEVSLDRVEGKSRVYKRTFYSGVTRYYYIHDAKLLEALGQHGLEVNKR